MEKFYSDDGRSKLKSLALTSTVLFAMFYLGIKNSQKFTYEQQVANRLVEFFDGENLIKAKSDFMHFLKNYDEEKAFNIVLGKGGFNEHS